MRHVQFPGGRRSTTTDQVGDREEAHRIVNPKDYPKTDQYPRFNGEGAYNLYGFIAKL